MKKELTEQDKLNNTQLARRRLLKAGVYMPPAILGVMIAAPQKAQAATVVCGAPVNATITISAWSTACCPCAQRLTSNSCLDAQCALGNCASCGATTNGAYATLAACQASFGAGCCTCTETFKVKGKKTVSIGWDRTCP